MTKLGYNLERRVVELFEKHGWVAFRVAGSGNDSFDVLAQKGGVGFAIECKNTARQRYLYVPSLQGETLLKLADEAGWTPCIVFSYERQPPRILELKFEHPRTEGGNFKITKKSGEDLRAVFEPFLDTTLFENYKEHFLKRNPLQLRIGGLGKR